MTSRGVDRRPIYLDDEDYGFFVAFFRGVVRSRPVKVRAFCLMPNHYHAIIETTRDQLSSTFHRLNGVYAQRFNERHVRVGHLFQDRFHARVVRDDEHFANACTYVWNNPVRVGLCREAHEWRWSGRI